MRLFGWSGEKDNDQPGMAGDSFQSDYRPARLDVVSCQMLESVLSQRIPGLLAAACRNWRS